MNSVKPANAPLAKQKIYLRPPVAYYGGKQSLLNYILPLVPPHQKYVEPFLGGGAVFWAKEPAPVEVINDLDGFVANFYRVMKSDFKALKTMIDATPFGREAHDEAATIRQRQKYFTNTQKAWAFFILANTSIYGNLANQQMTPTSDSRPSKTFYNKVGRVDNAYAERFNNVFIEQRDACYVIEKNDGPDVFMFCDPPYFNSDMGHYDGYTQSDYEALLNTLGKLKGKFIMTSYPSDILEGYVRQFNWRQMSFEMPLNAGAKGRRKTEVFTLNF